MLVGLTNPYRHQVTSPFILNFGSEFEGGYMQREKTAVEFLLYTTTKHVLLFEIQLCHHHGLIDTMPHIHYYIGIIQN